MVHLDDAGPPSAVQHRHVEHAVTKSTSRGVSRMSTDDAAILRRHIENLSAHDYDAFKDVIGPNAIAHKLAEEYEDAHGAEAITDMIRNFQTIFPDHEVAIDHILASDGFAAAQTTHRGTHLGEGSAVAPGGRRVEFRVHVHARIEDGQIVELWETWDRLGVREQMTAEV
jgi:predicted ester cyclase